MALITPQNIQGYLQVRFLKKNISHAGISFCFLLVSHRVFPHEHSQRISNNIFRTGEWIILNLLTYEPHLVLKSGQSLIEHSYKADSDLSPVGWEYAERLKDFVLERRAKTLEQRGVNPQDRRLVVHNKRTADVIRHLTIHLRSGRQLVAAHITPHGHSVLQQRVPPEATVPQ